ncbi:hypothetical protein AN958_12106 [Leucoagaricus sp. SymC.cos]|nr:hypothetical protein AN958_12106 [Leucoagaricus sp. SymC.cos]
MNQPLTLEQTDAVRDFQTLLSSNVPPTPEQATSLMELVQQEEYVSSKLLEDIARLQTQLDALVEQSCGSRMKAQQYRTVLSTARVLPAEIVRRIFIHCAEDSPVPLFPKARGHPLSLAQICSGWRKVALSTSELWNTINFEANSSTGVDKFIKLAREWFSRCHTGSVSLAFATRCRSPNVSELLSDIITKNSSKIGRLELHLPTPFLTAFEKYPPDAFPLLRNLELHREENFTAGDQGYRLDSRAFTPFQSAPNLTGVFISLPFTDVTPEDINLPWSQLSSLNLGATMIQPDEILRVFAFCSKLNSCTVFLFNGQDWSGRITLPHLTTLSLRIAPCELSEFLHCITVPALQTLDVYLFRIGQFASVIWNTQSFTQLVTRSQCRIERLVIEGRGLEMDGFADLLCSIPTLRELTLKNVSSDGPLSAIDALLRMTPNNYEDPVLPLLRVLRWKESKICWSAVAIRRFIATRGWPVPEHSEFLVEEGDQRQGVQRLETVDIRSCKERFRFEWDEQLLEFKNRGLDLSYVMHQD